MTLDKFRVKFFKFLEGSTVNLGRKTAATRQKFINEAKAMFDAFESDTKKDKCEEVVANPVNPMSDSIICIKPDNPNKALDVGKGVRAMTASESMRADEQLNRSPYTNKTKQKE